MEALADTSAEPQVPSLAAGVLGLAGASVPIAAAFTWFMGFPPIYPFVFVVTLAVVLAIGLPVFLVVRRRATWIMTLAGGFLTGAIVPALLVLLLPAADEAWSGGVQTVADGAYTWSGWLQNLAVIGGFGLVGVLGGVIARLLVRWLMAGGPTGRVAIGAIVAAGIVSIWLVPWAFEDRSCHNFGRDGRTSISPVASFHLHVTMAEWPEVQDELDRFAREESWQMREDIRPDPGFPWFQVSLCREPGTRMSVHKAAFEEDQISIYAYQPQGGDSWQSPLRELQDRLERRWPGRTGYDYGEFDGPRPPWAPPSRPAADARLHERENSL